MRGAALLSAARHLQGAAVGAAAPEAGEGGEAATLMGEMRRAMEWEEKQRQKRDRFASTLVIAASIIAAVRLAREDISRPSARLSSVVAESVNLAKTILDTVVR